MRHYVNSAPPLLLAVGIDAEDTTLTVASTDGYPDKFPFILTLAKHTEEQEVVLCINKDASSFTVVRGYDGTEAIPHGGGTLIEHTTTAIDYRESGIARVDITERDAMEGEELWEGRVVYNTDAKRFDFYTGTIWAGLLPVGALIPFAGSSAPDGFLLCNGDAVSRTTYAELFAEIGTTFGEGDGSTTFNLPDFRGRMPIGVAASGTASALGETGGAIDHTHTGPSHTHAAGTLTADEAGEHTHTNPTTSSVDLSHTHSNPNTSSAGSHSHTLTSGATSPVGDHTHTNPNTNSGGSHSHSASSGAPSSAGGRATGSTSTASDGHIHSITVSSGGSHSHSQGSTGSAGGHSHTIDTSMSSSGSHSHTQGNTGSALGSHSHTQGSTGSSGAHTHAISGSTAAAGTGNTGEANPPYLAVNWLIRV
jgi:microcystin-dependent protein